MQCGKDSLSLAGSAGEEKPQAKRCRRPLEAGKARKRMLSSSLQKERGSADTWL